jgi:hypothetical protein
MRDRLILSFFALVSSIVLSLAMAQKSSAEPVTPQPLTLIHTTPDTWGASLAFPVIEACRIHIVNDSGGEIAVSRDGGQTWKPLGKVTKFCEKVENKGYTASKWVTPVHVAATAVNAIHITTDYNEKDDRGVVFSLIPKEINTSRPSGPIPPNASFLSPSASIETDIPGGTAIFGTGYAPLVGNPLEITRAGVTAIAEKGYVPARGDVITILVQRSAKMPTQIVFENHEGGLVWMQFADGSRTVIASVIRPVHGVGRFTGAVFAEVGRIRANHAGVIDVSLSPLHAIAGFQIIPEGHAHSPEMSKALTMTQWMIVAPLPPQEAWEGVAPLFYGYLRPDYGVRDLYSDEWRERLLSRYLVEVKHGNGMWAASPSFTIDPDANRPLPEWCNTALNDVTAIRILLPVLPE